MATIPQRRTKTSRVSKLVALLFQGPNYAPFLNTRLSATQELGRGRSLLVSEAVVIQEPTVEGYEQDTYIDVEVTLTQEPMVDKETDLEGHE